MIAYKPKKAKMTRRQLDAHIEHELGRINDVEESARLFKLWLQIRQANKRRSRKS